jgi:hypothetical protein
VPCTLKEQGLSGNVCGINSSFDDSGVIQVIRGLAKFVGELILKENGVRRTVASCETLHCAAIQIL